MTSRQRQHAESLARQIRYILAKSPDEFGIVLDPEGWVHLKELVQVASEGEDLQGVTANRICDLAWQLPDWPFEVEEKRIRYVPPPDGGVHPPARGNEPPPTLLYFGARRRPYATYLEKGIKPSVGNEITLSRTSDLVMRIARRRDPNPVLVEIQTAIAESRGSSFQSYGSQLFLVDYLPPECLHGPPVDLERVKPTPKKRKPDPQKPTEPAPHPESFHSEAWDPSSDRLIARDPEEEKKDLKRKRLKKRVGWKDENREKRRSGQ